MLGVSTSSRCSRLVVWDYIYFVQLILLYQLILWTWEYYLICSSYCHHDVWHHYCLMIVETSLMMKLMRSYSSWSWLCSVSVLHHQSSPPELESVFLVAPVNQSEISIICANQLEASIYLVFSNQLLHSLNSSLVKIFRSHVLCRVDRSSNVSAKLHWKQPIHWNNRHLGLAVQIFPHF